MPVVHLVRQYCCVYLTLTTAALNISASSAIAIFLRPLSSRLPTYPSNIYISSIGSTYLEARKTTRRTMSRSNTTRAKKHPSSSAEYEESKNGGFPIPAWFNRERMRVLSSATYDSAAKATSKEKEKNPCCVVYWMQRDMRVEDNWALLYADYLAREVYRTPLRVVYAFSTRKSTRRHVNFLLGGLSRVEDGLHSLNIPIKAIHVDQLCGYLSSKPVSAAALVTDFSPLKDPVSKTANVVSELAGISDRIPVIQIDAHNVIPCWFVSDKKEVGARTLRPKINKLLPQFMTEFPTIKSYGGTDESASSVSYVPINWAEESAKYITTDESVPSVKWAQPGTKAGMDKFKHWLHSSGFKQFAEKRNNPTIPNVISNLSPWLNHGHISFQRLALTVRALNKYSNSTAAYLEEGIVRRELSDNFCFHNQDYDSLAGAANWARESLELHATDEREYIYSLEEFTQAKTHDDLWNAAQLQLVQEGKMHGFLRMYWAKKILEWTPNPTSALDIAQYLNDYYALDGNDPNGYVGVGWSIMGVHDMGWKERDIFGKIRFMNYAGCKRKFKVQDFVARYPKASVNAQESVSQSSQKVSGMKSASSEQRKRKETAVSESSSAKKKKTKMQETDSYDGLKVAELRNLCKERNFHVSGTKQTLLQRLREDS